MSRHTPMRIAFRRPWPGTRRGLCLWLFALAFVAIGFVNYIGTELPPTTRASLAFALDIAPVQVWGWALVGVGTVAAWSSYCHLGRDRYGFAILATFCTSWGGVYLCGWLFYGAGLRAVSGSLIWFLFAGALALIAGFPNVPVGRRQEGVR